MTGKKAYVLMVACNKLLQPTLEAATLQGSFDIRCTIEESPAAVSDDYDTLVEYAKKLTEEYPEIVGWNIRIVPNLD